MNDIEERLEILEQRCNEGKSSEVRREFWKIVGELKRVEIQLDDEILEKVARVHDCLWKDRKVLSYRISVLIFAIFLLSCCFFAYLALYKPEIPIPAGVVIECIVIYSGFLTGRCLAGFITGIRFEGFYRYNPLELGMKLDIRSYLKAGQKRRVLLFAIPILWVHGVLALQIILLSLLPSPSSTPSPLIWIPVIFLLSYIPFSYLIHVKFRTGELHRFLRELKILRGYKSSDRSSDCRSRN